MRILSILLLTIVVNFQSFAQEKIQLQDIWYSGKLYARSVPGFNFMKDGRHYTRQEGNRIFKYDILTGQSAGVIFDGDAVGMTDFSGFRFSDDEQKIVFTKDEESIYRHSTRANYFVYDLIAKTQTPVFTKGKQMYALLSPDAQKVAFVYDNNLYVKDLSTNKLTQITSDGQVNHIINGASDWVYEEELGVVRAYEWAPDSKKIAYYRFDESEVKEYTLNYYHDDVYPEPYTYKYPKVGEKNSIVDLYIYDLPSGKKIKVKSGEDKDTYIAKIQWSKDPNILTFLHLNRHQNHLKLFKTDAGTGASTVLLEEKSKYYVDNYNNLTFLPDGKQFLWTSDRSGFNHIYLYDMEGHLRKQITKGDWGVTKLQGFDKKRKVLYYQSSERDPKVRDVYAINLKGRNKSRITKGAGWNEISFSPTYDYYTLTHSTINSPPTYAIYTNEGKWLRSLQDNRPILKQIKAHGCTNVEFFDFTTSEGVKLNGWMITPPLFNPKKKYPLFMYLYGGPGNQQVVDQWRGPNYWWFQMLAQKGYVVACVDNRGTGGRGAEFKKMTYMQLGHYETIDQIEAAKYLSAKPFIDEKRTGIFGWSYGGYMSSLCLLKGNDVFEMGIAVAPVTNWKWYDSIYTERFMRTEKENPKGYHDNSPIYFANRLKGKYLLIHGLADDNVHFQNSAEMARALVEANKQYETYIYTNKNHGIYGGVTRLHLFSKMTNFIENNL
ncbi:MAG TPA: S9 family peptidase [Saprospiraceae bacterium]|nr:S9 family peptidase [Saprospiraceae bacterium]